MNRENLARLALEAVEEGTVLRLAQALVRLPSHWPEHGEEGVVAFLEGHLARLGLRTFRQEVAPRRPNLVADLGAGEGGLILEGHADVVTPGDPGAWTFPPYAGVLQGGRLYGRGAADMKGGLAAAVAALEAVAKVLTRPGRTLRLAVLADEEGMMAGVKAFVRAGHTRGFAGAIVCEPEENELCLWQKGALRLGLRLSGRMAHGAMPYAGANPIPPAGRFLVGLESLQAELQARYAHPYLGLPYLTPTQIRASAGEGQLNVIPDRLEMALDVRTVPGLDHGALLARIRGLLGEALSGTGVQGEVEVLEDRPPVETPKDDPLVEAVASALGLAGLPVRLGGVPGATDGTFLAAWGGLPVVVLGPGSRTIPHQVDEWVDLGEVVAAARVYAAAAVLFLTR